MEFWIGLSVGMHLGELIAGYLERFGKAYGLLSPEAVEKVKKIEEIADDLSSIADAAEE